MTLKVSIKLPGDAVITLEASEPQVYQEVVSLALRELPMDIIKTQGGATAEPGVAVGKNAAPLVPRLRELDSKANRSISPGPSSTKPAIKAESEAKEAFAGFCAESSPIGDMRRVVVATEGARRFLDIHSVSAEELGPLFDMAGWRQPANFLQALRNAARSKFRWLERVPGSAGYYSVTDTGREKIGASTTG